jgi:hypothetical protein
MKETAQVLQQKTGQIGEDHGGCALRNLQNDMIVMPTEYCIALLATTQRLSAHLQENPRRYTYMETDVVMPSKA